MVGLDPYRTPWSQEPKSVADEIEAGLARFAEHGVGVEICQFGLDGSDDVEGLVTDALRARTWECVIVGAGVRRPQDQVDLFEQLVNQVRRHAPNAAIAFNSFPDDNDEAAGRWIDIPRPTSVS